MIFQNVNTRSDKSGCPHISHLTNIKAYCDLLADIKPAPYLMIQAEIMAPEKQTSSTEHETHAKAHTILLHILPHIGTTFS